MKQRELLKVLFKEKTAEPAEVSIDYLDIFFPEFDSRIDRAYDEYNDLQLYDSFTIEWEDEYVCALGFTAEDMDYEPEDEDEEDEALVYGVVEWNADKNLNIINLDWYTD